MITEMIRMSIEPGTREQFLESFGSVAEAYYAQPGCESHRLFEQRDDDDAVLGIVEWSDYDAHVAALESPAGKAFLAVVVPLLDGAPQMWFGREI